MNKRTVFIVLTLISIATYIGISLFVNKQHAKKENHHRIALFTPITHPALQEIEHDFQETLNKTSNASFDFTVFNANGNKTLQRAQAEEIINGNYDLIFSIGTSSTQLIAEIAKKKGVHTPHVFCSVEDPVGMGIVQSLESSGNAITGVIEAPSDYQKVIALMLQLKPNTKNILLIYDPGVNFSMEKEKQKLHNTLKQTNIALHSVEISQANEIAQKVPGLLQGNDFVLVLKDNTVVSGIDSLITLCNRYRIPLFVSDLNSGKKGALIAYGIREGDSGIGAAQKAAQILIEHKQPTHIPITPVENMRIAINKEAIAQQGVDIPQDLLKKIEEKGNE